MSAPLTSHHPITHTPHRIQRSRSLLAEAHDAWVVVAHVGKVLIYRMAELRVRVCDAQNRDDAAGLDMAEIRERWDACEL